MKNLKLIIVFLITCMIVLPSSLSAELSDAQFEIIKIAFMNGYVNALKSDINTIQALKQDQKKMKYFSRNAVDNYMEKVTLLNQDKAEINKSKKPVYSGSNTLSL